MDSSMDFLL